MTPAVLKFGLVGCGRASENHLKALSSGQLAAQLVAVDAEIQHQSSQDVPNVYGRGHLPYLANVIEAIFRQQGRARQYVLSTPVWAARMSS